MRRAIVFGLSFLLAATCRANGPKLVCEGTMMADVYAGYVRTFDLEIRNAGNETLNITDIKATCGCTVPRRKTCSIAPNGRETIRIEYKPQKLSGPFQQNVVLISNDGEQPHKLVVLKGNVLRSDFATSTNAIALTKTLGTDTIPSGKVDVTSQRKLVYLDAKLTRNGFLLSARRQSDKSFSIEITARDNESRPGIVTDLLKMRFLVNRKEVVTELPVTYEVKPEFSVYPPKVVLPCDSNDVFARLLLKSELENKPIAVDEVSVVGLRGLTTRCTKLDDQNSFIYVSGKYEWLNESRHSLVIRLADTRSVEVPITRDSN